MRSTSRVLAVATCLALTHLTTPSAQAHEELGWPATPHTQGVEPTIFRDEPIIKVHTRTLDARDPDGTGYPMISNWRGCVTTQTAPVHLNAEERDRLTSLRVTTSEKLQKQFDELILGFRPLLSSTQRQAFDTLIYELDPAQLSAQPEEAWTAWRHAIGIRLSLNGVQMQQLRPLVEELQVATTSTHSAFVSSFEEVVASAERRTAAERLRRSIGTGAP